VRRSIRDNAGNSRAATTLDPLLDHLVGEHKAYFIVLGKAHGKQTAIFGATNSAASGNRFQMMPGAERLPGSCPVERTTGLCRYSWCASVMSSGRWIRPLTRIHLRASVISLSPDVAPVAQRGRGRTPHHAATAPLPRVRAACAVKAGRLAACEAGRLDARGSRHARIGCDLVTYCSFAFEDHATGIVTPIGDGHRPRDPAISRGGGDQRPHC
jgi:hypothetical protein